MDSEHPQNQTPVLNREAGPIDPAPMAGYY